MSLKFATLDGIATLEMARPEKKNALTVAMYAEMTDALTAAGQDSTVRVVLMTGQPGVFCAGNDLEDFVTRPPMDGNSPVFQFMKVLSGFDKPVVAAVTGPAIGIGTTMLLHCDLVYAGDDVRFALPFVSLGLVPEFAASVLLAQAAGRVKAAEKLLLGEPFGADEALEMRLINAVLPPREVVTHARRVAQRFMGLPPVAVQQTKQLLRRAQAKLVEETIGVEAALFHDRLRSPEAQEAFQAFFQKRKPDFSKF